MKHHGNRCIYYVYFRPYFTHAHCEFCNCETSTESPVELVDFVYRWASLCSPKLFTCNLMGRYFQYSSKSVFDDLNDMYDIAEESNSGEIAVLLVVPSTD